MATAAGATKTQALRGQSPISVHKLLVAEHLWLLHACSLGAGSIVQLVELLVVCEGLQGSACKLQASFSALCFLSQFHGLNEGQVFLNRWRSSWGRNCLTIHMMNGWREIKKSEASAWHPVKTQMYVLCQTSVFVPRKTLEKRLWPSSTWKLWKRHESSVCFLLSVYCVMSQDTGSSWKWSSVFPLRHWALLITSCTVEFPIHYPNVGHGQYFFKYFLPLGWK